MNERDAVKKALQYINERNLSAARILLSKFPNSSQSTTIYAHGALLFWEGKLEDAEVYFRQALAQQPESAKVNFYLGRIALARGNRDLARTLYSEAARLDPANAAYRSAVYELSQPQAQAVSTRVRGPAAGETLARDPAAANGTQNYGSRAAERREEAGANRTAKTNQPQNDMWLPTEDQEFLDYAQRSARKERVDYWIRTWFSLPALVRVQNISLRHSTYFYSGCIAFWLYKEWKRHAEIQIERAIQYLLLSSVVFCLWVALVYIWTDHRARSECQLERGRENGPRSVGQAESESPAQAAASVPDDPESAKSQVAKSDRSTVQRLWSRYGTLICIPACAWLVAVGVLILSEKVANAEYVAAPGHCEFVGPQCRGGQYYDVTHLRNGVALGALAVFLISSGPIVFSRRRKAKYSWLLAQVLTAAGIATLISVVLSRSNSSFESQFTVWLAILTAALFAWELGTRYRVPRVNSA